MSNFNVKVWEKLKEVPAGKITTYKDLALAVGSTAYRAVGNAMNKNPYGAWDTTGSQMVPCHRVVNSTGHLHGFAHGLDAKRELLEKEGLVISENKVVDFEKKLFKF